MGQKIRPYGFRVGISKPWRSRWYANKKAFGTYLVEDSKIRKHITSVYRFASIPRVEIERKGDDKLTVYVFTAKPGMLIGKKTNRLSDLEKEISLLTDGKLVDIRVMEVQKPELDAQLIAEGVAQQLERRIAFRRAMKRAVQSAMRLGAEGIRINCGGRLGGAEIARMEWYREGRVPLHTLRADIDYGTAEASTAYGICGVKVWVFKGEILEHDPMAAERRATEGAEQGGGSRRQNA